jgi:predicted nucleic acid-binding Zn ribbon protein
MVYLFDKVAKVYAHCTIGAKPSVVASIKDAATYKSERTARNDATTFGRTLAKYKFDTFYLTDSGKYKEGSTGIEYDSPEDSVAAEPQARINEHSSDTQEMKTIDSQANINCKCSREELEKSLDNLGHILTEMHAEENILKEELGKVDRKISDVMHYIELNAFNASKGYQLCKKLKDLRIERRGIKDRMAWNFIIKQMNYTSVITGSTVNSLKGLDTRKYTPREDDYENE